MVRPRLIPRHVCGKRGLGSRPARSPRARLPRTPEGAGDVKPVMQTKFGGSDAPESEQGNCIAACLASIFECSLEDVPDFTGSIVAGGWFFHLQKWLAECNLSLLMLPAKPIDVPAGYAMAAVKSLTLPNPDDGHMVVVNNGMLAHDPNPKNTGKSPDDYEVMEYWAFTCRDPARGAR